MVLSKGTHYADTARAVADAREVLAAARAQFFRAQDAVAQQSAQRAAEARRESARLRQFARVDEEILSPTRAVVLGSIFRLSDEVEFASATAAALASHVQRVERLLTKREAGAVALRRQVREAALEREACLESMGKLTDRAKSSLTASERMMHALDRDIRVAEEEHEFLSIQLQMLS